MSENTDIDNAPNFVLLAYYADYVLMVSKITTVAEMDKILPRYHAVRNEIIRRMSSN